MSVNVGSVILGVLLSGTTFAQGTSPGSVVLSRQGYSQLLDTQFPRVYPASLKRAWLTILRFEPNRGVESQLAIEAWHDGHIEATLYTIQGRSAWAAGNAYIARAGREDLGSIAKSIRVQKRVLSLQPSDLEKRHALFFAVARDSESALERSAAEFRTSGNRNTVLDGDRYELWYVQGETETHWSFSDVHLDDAPGQAILPLAKWMAMVRAGATKN
jgi:hypothetical protein